MKTSHRAVAEILRAGKVIARRDHPELADSLDYLVARGHLVRVLPGVCAKPPADDIVTRVAAVMAWDRDAIVVGAAAARLWFWPAISCPTVDVALRRRADLDRAGFRFTRRLIPPELTAEWSGVRMTVPALTALDLCEALGGDAIDVALRTREATLRDLRQALELTPDRPGNAVRRDLIHESRDQPWSPPERRLHRLLRAAGLGGWTGNATVRGPGWRCCPDVAFEDDLLAAEVDGREHHNSAVAFERDHARQNRLVCAGWTVLRFTPTMIDADPEGVISTIRDTLERLRAQRAAA